MTSTAPQTPAVFPAWFAARQHEAWERYLATPAPKRGDETWRFSNIKQLDFAGFTNAGAWTRRSDLIARSTGLGIPRREVRLCQRHADPFRIPSPDRA